MDVNVRCPACGRPGIPIVYGLPGPETFVAAERGEVVIGGCCIAIENPTHECAAGHRWQEPAG